MRGRWAAAALLSCAATHGCGSGSEGPSTAVAPDAGALPADEMTLLASLSPSALPPPPIDVTNRFADDPAAAHLGQELFFDPAFAGALLETDNDGSPATLGVVGQTGRVACAGCHIPSSGFADTRSLDEQISLAAGWGLRKAPSLLDVGQDTLVAWDGRRDALYNQVFAPLESPLEMNTSRLFVAEELARRYGAEYGSIFGPIPAFDDPAQFPPIAAALTGCTPSGPLTPTCSGATHGMPGDHAEYDGLSAADQQAVTLAAVNFGKAVEAFERTLACGPGRFDLWMHGDAGALSASEIRGAGLFVGAAQCVSCHSGPYLSDQRFHNVGVQPAQINFSAPPDTGDHGAIVGVAGALADPLDSRGPFSDGYDGRLPASVPPTWAGAFKTPMLRCVAQRPSFLHTAQMKTLSDVVAFFDEGGGVPEYGTSELHPLHLTADQELDLVDFLGALSGPGPQAGSLQPP